MLRRFQHAGTEGSLVGQPALVAVEVSAGQVAKRAVRTPRASQKASALRQGQHGKRDVTDPGDRKAVGADAELHP
ncbi:hypothetical protein D3C71_1813350 [compost metagenome]